MAEVVRREMTWRPDGRQVERSVIRCSCGEEVLCRLFTNSCECGRDYNMSGQMLAPRDQWGEETGESVSDILMVDWMVHDG